MNFAKGKSRKLLGTASIALMLTTSLATMINTELHTVKADNAEMVDLPKGVNSQGAKYPGEYSFIPTVKKGITTVRPFGGTSDDWYTSSTNTEDMTKHWNVLAINDDYFHGGKDNVALKGKAGLYYSNVGTYKGHIVDIKITLMDWKIDSYKWVEDSKGKQSKATLPGTYVAFGVDDFEIFTPGAGAVKYRMDYIDHDNHKPIKINGQWTFRDIDGNQWVGIDNSTFSGIDTIYYGDPNNRKTWLSYKKMIGTNYIYSDANQHNTPFETSNGHNAGTVTSNQLKAAFTATYSNLDHFTMTWVYGDNTGKNAVASQKELEADQSYWSMNGKYDPDADNTTISKINKTIDGMMFNHAYLSYGSKPIVKDKPKSPVKYVSDSDEGTNVPSEIGTNKSVDHDILKNRYETYNYQITHDVPDVSDEFKYTEYRITDSLDKILDVSNVHVYNSDNQDVSYMFTTNVDSSNRLSVIAKSDSLKNDDFYRQQYKITFDAKIKQGVSLADHMDPKHKDQAVIVNKAKVTTDNGTADSNDTTTNVPFTEKSQVKAVSSDGTGKGDNLEVSYDEEYNYTIDVVVPDSQDVTSIELKDKLEDVLDVKDVKIYDQDDNGKDITTQGKLTKENNTVDWTANEPTKWHGKHLRMIIGASVKNTPDLIKYLDKDSKMIKIPNNALWIINGKDDPTNIVTVQPKGPQASVHKWIEIPSLD